MYDTDSNSYKNGIPKQYYYLKDYDFKEWEIPPWDVHIDKSKCIGEGAFGKAFVAKWRGTPIVAKVANQSLSEDDKLQLIQEFEQMTKLHHPNVVQLLGYIRNPFVILIEYFPNGNLEMYLKKNKLDIQKKIEISIDILRAIAYMHNRKPQYLIHRDIKKTNILVNSHGKIKISDFGLSRMIYNRNQSNLSENQSDYINLNSDLTVNVGTYRYMAPEILLSNNYTEKIDIWSCGIVLYELFENTKFIIPDLTSYKTSLQNDTFEPMFNITPQNIQFIIKQYMLQSKPHNRASAKTLIINFENELPCQTVNKSSTSCCCFY
tara:strand:- start:59 stop:1018 length:960 start_codon:yes stop_codon:yes gene_type:complete